MQVTPKLPDRLVRLRELANNLWYSWDARTQALFSRLGSKAWLVAGHSPKNFLNRIEQKHLDEAAEDPEFLGSFERVIAAYDAYHSPARVEHGPRMADGDLVAYFCAEFGFHESLPIYSGGLGILAGDHCKTASDMKLPFVGIGLLYRQGYFLQTIDGDGIQEARYHDSNFGDLPISPALGPDGKELHVSVELADRSVEAKVWHAQVGVVTLYLLDTDIAQNSSEDRDITHRLYGGDRTTRIEQEMVLGIGGVRTLHALGLAPTVWHINEGHAAFLIIERVATLVRQGVDLAVALEAVASNTVFTTHTPVPAGHDHFSEEMITEYFARYAAAFGGSEALLALGRDELGQEFNMTALAIRGSRHQNGVSRIHGEVSADICREFWPQIAPEENPIGYVTNGAHVPSFLSDLWHDLFHRYLGTNWQHRITEATTWQAVHDIPDHEFWYVRQAMKAQLLYLIRYQMTRQHDRNYASQAHLDRMLKHADPDNPSVLTIGFGRRFATYKRATMLFQDLDWLRRIVTHPERPVVFVFAGKAHPADKPGQALIQRIAEVAAMPEFQCHILLLEGYDLHLSRRLVAGVDVWLNNPLYPLEASGTSGMKAAFNGVLNLSVLDGWWAEGYEPGGAHPANGWAIKPVSTAFDEERRTREEARALYELLQDQVAPLYYDRKPMGYSSGWVAMAKRSIATIAPRFNSQRMVGEYVTRYYRPAALQWQRYSADQYAASRDMAAWKARVREAWSGVALRNFHHVRNSINFGESIAFSVTADLNGMRVDDVVVELILTNTESLHEEDKQHFRFTADGDDAAGGTIFRLKLKPEMCGRLEYRVRIYPSHELLSHPFEMGRMVWL